MTGLFFCIFFIYCIYWIYLIDYVERAEIEKDGKYGRQQTEF